MIQKFLGVDVRTLSWLERTWLLAPFAIWFSYQPFVRLGQDSTSYYELSIAVLYTLILALVGLPAVWRNRSKLARDKSVWVTGAFVGLSIVSLAWTPTTLRGVLTTGMIGMLFLVFLAGLAKREQLRRLLPALTKLLISSALLVSMLAVVQLIVGIWLPRAETLLCAGCIADQFGFVRPNVFAIEPQFLGSLLLAPLLVLLHQLINGRRDKLVIGSFLLISSALFLTLSRGAIFAFAVGVLLLLALNWRKAKAIVGVISLTVVAFAITLVTQGATAALNPRVEVTFYEAVSASINQLSLGIISLPENSAVVVEQTSTTPAFDGYVEESTNTRLGLSQLAVETWASSPVRVFFGVGVGGSGAAVHNQFPSTIDAREIVQNEYIEILLEYGVLGAALFATILVGFFYGTRRHVWVWALALAYIVQWNFFSGYPNALHIYLILIALYIALRTIPSEHRAEG